MKNLSVNNKIKKGHLRNDILLIVFLLLIAMIGGIYLFVFRKSGDVVKVTVDGKVYGEYSLTKDKVVEIYTGKDNEQLNTLVIAKGKAFVGTATCPDGICANHREIFRDGESIICLPHKVVITVVAKKNDDTPDAVA